MGILTDKIFKFVCVHLAPSQGDIIQISLIQCTTRNQSKYIGWFRLLAIREMSDLIYQLNTDKSKKT